MDDTLREVYAKRCVGPDSEGNKKWAVGPFTFEQITDRLGPPRMGCRGFGVAQGTEADDQGKELPQVRQTDDLSEYFANARVACTEQTPCAG